jgi:RNA polymerase sigma-70 factor, ECF subfamily
MSSQMSGRRNAGRHDLNRAEALTMHGFAIAVSSPTMLIRRKSAARTETTRDGDAALLQSYIEGDDAAFAELFDRHHHRLYLYCLKIVGDDQQAEDLMQEVWERVIKLRLKPQRIDNPAGFLVTMTRNLCFNHVKQQRRRTFLNTFVDRAETAVAAHEHSDLAEHMKHALSQLSLEYREVLVLQVYCDYDYDEIAAMLNMNVTAIRMRASRARAQLRTILESMGRSADLLIARSLPFFDGESL